MSKKKVLCPKCGKEGKHVYSHYVVGSLFKHKFYRCTSCLWLWDRDQQLKVEKEMLKGEIPRYFKAEPES